MRVEQRERERGRSVRAGAEGLARLDHDFALAARQRARGAKAAAPRDAARSRSARAPPSRSPASRARDDRLGPSPPSPAPATAASAARAPPSRLGRGRVDEEHDAIAVPRAPRARSRPPRRPRRRPHSARSRVDLDAHAGEGARAARVCCSSSCPGCYYAHLAEGQLRLLRARATDRPGARRPRDAARRRAPRLALVAAVRAFAAALGLHVGGQYTGLCRVAGRSRRDDGGRDARRRDRARRLLVPGGRHACPTRDSSIRARRARGGRRCARAGSTPVSCAVPAYSTLGWFDDPVTAADAAARRRRVRRDAAARARARDGLRPGRCRLQRGRRDLRRPGGAPCASSRTRGDAAAPRASANASSDERAVAARARIAARADRRALRDSPTTGARSTARARDSKSDARAALAALPAHDATPRASLARTSARTTPASRWPAPTSAISRSGRRASTRSAAISPPSCAARARARPTRAGARDGAVARRAARRHRRRRPRLPAGGLACAPAACARMLPPGCRCCGSLPLERSPDCAEERCVARSSSARLPLPRRRLSIRCAPRSWPVACAPTSSARCAASRRWCASASRRWSPAATCSSRTCRASARPRSPTRSRARSTRASGASSSPATCCPRTWSAPRCPRCATAARPARFAFQPGPLFAQVVLADEINRASPKTQSALLEAMAEGVGERRRRRPTGCRSRSSWSRRRTRSSTTAPIRCPSRSSTASCCGSASAIPIRPTKPRCCATTRRPPSCRGSRRCSSADELVAMRAAAERVKFDDALVAYLLAIVRATRAHPSVSLGVSPRGAVALRRVAQARALVDGRDYCIPEDVRDLAVDVLAHRVLARSARGRRRRLRGGGVDDARDPGRRGRPALAAGLRRAVAAGSPAPCAATAAPAAADARRLALLRAGLRDRLRRAQHRQQPALPGALAAAGVPGALGRALGGGAARHSRRAPAALRVGGGPRRARRPRDLEYASRKTWAHAIVVEDLGVAPGDPAERALGRAFALRVAPGTDRVALLPLRAGRDAASCASPASACSTRFPFGLFAKSLETPARGRSCWCIRASPRSGRPRGACSASRARSARPRAAARSRRRSDRAARLRPRRLAAAHPLARFARAAGSCWCAKTPGSAGGEAEVRPAHAHGARDDDFERGRRARRVARPKSGLRAGLRVALRTDDAALRRRGSGAVHRARLLGFLALVEPERRTRTRRRERRETAHPARDADAPRPLASYANRARQRGRARAHGPGLVAGARDRTRWRWSWRCARGSRRAAWQRSAWMLNVGLLARQRLRARACGCAARSRWSRSRTSRISRRPCSCSTRAPRRSDFLLVALALFQMVLAANLTDSVLLPAAAARLPGRDGVDAVVAHALDGGDRRPANPGSPQRAFTPRLLRTTLLASAASVALALRHLPAPAAPAERARSPRATGSAAPRPASRTACRSATSAASAGIRRRAARRDRARRPQPAPEHSYWRGLAFDHFDGRHWSITPPARQLLPGAVDFGVRVSRTPGPPDLVQRVLREPVPSGVLFGAGAPIEVAGAIGRVERDPNGGLYAPESSERRVHYTVESRVAMPDRAALRADRSVLPAQDGERFLALPALAPEVAALALRIAPPGAAGRRPRARRRGLASPQRTLQRHAPARGRGRSALADRALPARADRGALRVLRDRDGRAAALARHSRAARERLRRRSRQRVRRLRRALARRRPRLGRGPLRARRLGALRSDAAGPAPAGRPDELARADAGSRRSGRALVVPARRRVRPLDAAARASAPAGWRGSAGARTRPKARSPRTRRAPSDGGASQSPRGGDPRSSPRPLPAARSACSGCAAARRGEAQLPAAYAEALALLERQRGLVRARNLPARDFARRSARALPPAAAAAFWSLTEAYLAERFGGHRTRESRRALRALRDSLRA